MSFHAPSIFSSMPRLVQLCSTGNVIDCALNNQRTNTQDGELHREVHEGNKKEFIRQFKKR